tara:strand:- start:67 stop:288 length:222 start_codon:yes stop_codon:yes gene_type:complete
MELNEEQRDIIESVNSDAYGFTNYLTDISKTHNLNMWDEIIDYFKEKRACDENYTKRECSCFENKNVLEMKRK